MSNFIGSFTQSYPVAGSFSRSAVNYQAGAQTGLANAVSSGFVLLTLLFFTGLLYHIPQPVLAAIIIMSVIGLVNFRKIMEAWHTHRSDGLVAIITFLATLFFAPDLDRGILVGVLLSTAFYIYYRTKPHVAIISQDQKGQFHDAIRLKLPQCDHITIIRSNGIGTAGLCLNTRIANTLRARTGGGRNA